MRQPLITKFEKSVWVINVAHVSAHQNWLLRKSKVIVLWKKSLLVFWPRPKSVTEPYCQKWAKNSILLKIGIFSTWSINKKWFFCEKNHFCFSSQVQKMSKNSLGNCTHGIRWKNWVLGNPRHMYPNSTLVEIGIFFTWQENKKWFFCEKIHYCFSSQVQKMSNLAEIEFLAHFWQYGSVTYFGLGQKTKSDFFHKRITFCLLSNFF